MEDGKNNPGQPNTNSGCGGTTAALHQQLLMQQHTQRLRLLHHYQQQQQQQQLQQHQQHPSLNLYQQQQQQQQQQAGAISRFPSNIDAHLRSPGLRSLPLQQQQQQQQQPAQAQAAQQQVRAGAGLGGLMGRPQGGIEVEMAQHDAARVCNPDFKRPFSSIEDAVLRLLPYHVVADYEAEEDDRLLDSDTTGQVPSRLQQWDQNILNKIAEFTGTFEKQVLAFNIMSRKRAYGEFRSEERLMLEQALLREEKQALLELRAEIESREKAGREAAEAKMRMAMAQAEHARVEAQVHAEMISQSTPMRASAMGILADDGPGQDVGQEQGGHVDEMTHGWGNSQREEDDPSEDFLNDENETENGETGRQGEWHEAGELDLNAR